MYWWLMMAEGSKIWNAEKKLVVRNTPKTSVTENRQKSAYSL